MINIIFWENVLYSYGLLLEVLPSTPSRRNVSLKIYPCNSWDGQARSVFPTRSYYRKTLHGPQLYISAWMCSKEPFKTCKNHGRKWEGCKGLLNHQQVTVAHCIIMERYLFPAELHNCICCVCVIRQEGGHVIFIKDSYKKWHLLKSFPGTFCHSTFGNQLILLSLLSIQRLCHADTRRVHVVKKWHTFI